MKLHVFNPEHDIALAANSRFWTAPHAGRQLRADLGWLPSIWADDGDMVIVSDDEQAANALRKQKCRTADVRLVTLSTLACENLSDVQEVMPWGWDLSIFHQLLRAGVPQSLLPDQERLDKIRSLSDRAMSVALLRELCEEFELCLGESRILHSTDEIAELMQEWNGMVLKAPWSSSGRGVRFVECHSSLIASSVEGKQGKDRDADNNIRWAEKVIRTQGHIMAERRLDKIYDFGMEFMAHSDGRVTFEGLSLFSTSGSAYEGNILATEKEKTAMLSVLVPEELLVEVQRFICQWMNKKISGIYVGPFGVDMMLVKSDDGRVMLDPCVEVNLRRTMGHVALSLSPSEPGLQQIMRIGYEGSNYHFRIVNDHEIFC